MRLTTLLFAATANARLVTCNAGTAGNGGYEAINLYSYYSCNANVYDPYIFVRDITVLSQDPNGHFECLPAGTQTKGRRYCAP
ncbi:hypothetical protein CORC01_02670 [Colletotrichum orchidophilum]|uniref:Uncharacterized protein n=1 Tax=Colletotrichum orchidophilum TaxID=1209926 RepID=A0A1G4BKX2_9PEZI|nr:uncharacterized protein CORC01_02670 [Colletotrichum orchidophilum]OHF02091.1 hypothetical protein CORC01_02670 [Colletotrichum orchidophilum]